MTIIISLLVKLSFDIGHESPRQELNGWVHKKVACVKQDVGIHVCIKGIRSHTQGNQNWCMMPGWLYA
jgi:hypothetical protein